MTHTPAVARYHLRYRTWRTNRTRRSLQHNTKPIFFLLCQIAAKATHFLDVFMYSPVSCHKEEKHLHKYPWQSHYLITCSAGKQTDLWGFFFPSGRITPVSASYISTRLGKHHYEALGTRKWYLVQVWMELLSRWVIHCTVTLQCKNIQQHNKLWNICHIFLLKTHSSGKD